MKNVSEVPARRNENLWVLFALSFFVPVINTERLTVIRMTQDPVSSRQSHASLKVFPFHEGAGCCECLTVDCVPKVTKG